MLKQIGGTEIASSKIAIIDSDNNYSYAELNKQVSEFSGYLSKELSLKGERICFMIEPRFKYVKTLLAIWRSGAIAVPICLSHPKPQIEYVIDDTNPALVICSTAYLAMLKPICEERQIHLINISTQFDSKDSAGATPNLDDGALILYTSGTTSKPKGVLITHSNIEAQVSSLTSAWGWSVDDHILCTLPLHHIHGIVNVLCCALSAGACCEFIESFDADSVFSRFEGGNINLFMAVPTIYYKLINFYNDLESSRQTKISEAMNKFRLMVSGSAALPVSTLERWKEISSHTLLERYGMTEIGMALSNPYKGERRAGHVGLPLPGVEVRLCNENDNPVESGSGEIQIRGKTVFKYYWNRQEATSQAFTSDGWFKTGDLGIIENGYFKILGRLSVDIIKTGGYKISALEIEEVLRHHEAIADCGVVGIEDAEWGEKVVAAIVTVKEIDQKKLVKWLKSELPPYKVPKEFKIVESLPRNSMGKVTKNEIKTLF